MRTFVFIGEGRIKSATQFNSFFSFQLALPNGRAEEKKRIDGGWRIDGNGAAFSSRLLWWVKGCPQPLAPPKRRQARREESSGMSLISLHLWKELIEME